VLETRKKEILSNEDLYIESSKITTPLTKNEKSYDNLIKTERAIVGLRRAVTMPAMQWSDSLFLSADKHCQEQKRLCKPNILLDVFNDQGKLIAKQRPSTNVAEYSTATNVEIVVGSGKSVMDRVLDMYLAPENRSILFSP